MNLIVMYLSVKATKEQFDEFFNKYDAFVYEYQH